MTLAKINQMVMNEKKITTINVTGVQAHYTNEYDPDTCHTGGGYCQYAAVVSAVMLSADNKVVGYMTYNFEDYGCGDFGTRYDKGIVISDANNNAIYSDGVNYGSMIDEPGDPIEFITKIAGFINWEYESVNTLINGVFHDAINDMLY